MWWIIIFLQIIIIIIIAIITIIIVIIGLNQNERATRRNCTRCNFWARTTLEGDDYLFGHHHQRRFCIIIIIIDNIMTNRSINPTHKRYCQNQILLSNYQTYLHRFIRSSLWRSRRWVTKVFCKGTICTNYGLMQFHNFLQTGSIFFQYAIWWK